MSYSVLGNSDNYNGLESLFRFFFFILSLPSSCLAAMLSAINAECFAFISYVRKRLDRSGEGESEGSFSHPKDSRKDFKESKPRVTDRRARNAMTSRWQEFTWDSVGGLTCRTWPPISAQTYPFPPIAPVETRPCHAHIPRSTHTSRA